MFATVRDVRLALTPGGSSTGSATAASLSNTQIEDALAEAAGIVRTYVERRYSIPEPETVVVVGEAPVGQENTVETVPLAPYPVRGWTRNIAAYLASLTFSENQDVVADDPVRLRYNLTMEDLEKVQSGVLSLDLPGVGGGSGDGTGVSVVNILPTPLFGLSDAHLVLGGSSPQILAPYRRW